MRPPFAGRDRYSLRLSAASELVGDHTQMTVYDETIATVRALAARARTTENVLFCEQRPLTSLEAQFAGDDDLALRLREIEDDAIRALKVLVDSEQGYETALQSVRDAGADATSWLRAVMLARSLETLSLSSR